MSLKAGRYQLTNAFKALQNEWDATENVWRDQVRTDFAETYWQPLAVRLTAVLVAMDRLDQALEQMKRDCDVEP